LQHRRGVSARRQTTTFTICSSYKIGWPSSVARKTIGASPGAAGRPTVNVAGTVTMVR
jgi:hypothetical protein